MRLANPRIRAAWRRLASASATFNGTLISVATRERVAALTFDDGPHPEWTPAVCELLEEHGARGTFFMVGAAAARHRQVVERVAAGGHAIGNHSWDHPSFRLVGGGERRRQIERARQALAPWGSALFRPPYGHQSPASQLDAVRFGYRVVAWSAMAEDWADDPAETLLERVSEQLAPGGIVLFHDALWTALEESHRDRTATLEALGGLFARHADWRFVTVPELLTLGRPRKWHWYKRADREWLERVR